MSKIVLNNMVPITMFSELENCGHYPDGSALVCGESHASVGTVMYSEDREVVLYIETNRSAVINHFRTLGYVAE